MQGEDLRKMVSAAEAVARLKVSLPTLYAYASRGMIHTETPDGNMRARLYSVADIERLIWRKTKARRPAAAAATALSWGLPVLETQISAIANGGLTYRGRDIAELAASHTLEEVAELLWQRSDAFAEARFDPDFVPGWSATATLIPAEAGIDRAIALMALVRRAVPAGAVGSAWLVRALAAAFVVPLPDPRLPLHEALARIWGRPAAAGLIRRILVSCADHELNASTFTVRVAASSDVDMATCLLTGLTAVCGQEQIELIGRTRGMVAEALARIEAGRGDLDAVFAAWARPGIPLPGFYHRLYPDGDPRARAILAGVDLPEGLARLAEEVAGRLGLLPNIEFAMIAAERLGSLPAGAAEALFATGRSVGWIAHVIEQRASGIRIRPRAGPGIPARSRG